MVLEDLAARAAGPSWVTGDIRHSCRAAAGFSLVEALTMQNKIEKGEK